LKRRSQKAEDTIACRDIMKNFKDDLGPTKC
jgi:hypothetical protein